MRDEGRTRPNAIARAARALAAPARGLPRAMRALFLAQVVNRMGDFVAPFLALFITAKAGSGEGEAGFFVAATVVSSMAGGLLAGRLSDLAGRKPILVGAMAASAALIGLCGFLPPRIEVAWVLVAAAFFQGSIRPVIAALIADLCPPERRKDGYAVNYFGINIGVAIGPMVAGFLFETSLPWLFWADAISTAAAIAIVARGIPPMRPEALHEAALRAGKGGAGERPEAGSALRAFLARPELLLFCALLLAVNYVYFQINFALPLSARASFGAAGAAIFGGAMSLNAATVLAFTPIAMAVTRKRPAAACMAVGTALYALGFGALAFPLSPALIYGSTLVWSAGEVLFSVFVGEYLSSRSPVNFRGRFQAFRELFAGTGRVASPAVSGLLIAGAGLRSVWILSSALGAVLAVGFIALHRADRRAAGR